MTLVLMCTKSMDIQHNLHLMRGHVHTNSSENRTACSSHETTAHLVAREPASRAAEQRRSETLLALRAARAGRIALLMRGRGSAVV
jgi:hypothetical protein